MEERAITVLKQFYSKVHQSCVSMDAVTQQLRSYYFFTPVHDAELEACDTRVKKTTFIIDHVVKYYLEDGEEKPLVILLKLIGGDDNEIDLLAKEMKSLYSQKPVLMEKMTSNGENKNITLSFTCKHTAGCVQYLKWRLIVSTKKYAKKKPIKKESVYPRPLIYQSFTVTIILLRSSNHCP